MQSHPKYTNAYSGLGSVLYAKGYLDEAIDAYRKFIEFDPKDAKVHTNLGTALPAKGEFDGAITVYREAIALDRKLALAHANLGNALRVNRHAANYGTISPHS